MLSLGANAFRTCSSLSQVTFINGLTNIGPNMFCMTNGIGTAVSTSLGSVTMPSTIIVIGYTEITYWRHLVIYVHPTKQNNPNIVIFRQQCL